MEAGEPMFSWLMVVTTFLPKDVGVGMARSGELWRLWTQDGIDERRRGTDEAAKVGCLGVVHNLKGTLLYLVLSCQPVMLFPWRLPLMIISRLCLNEAVCCMERDLWSILYTAVLCFARKVLLDFRLLNSMNQPYRTIPQLQIELEVGTPSTVS